MLPQDLFHEFLHEISSRFTPAQSALSPFPSFPLIIAFPISLLCPYLLPFSMNILSLRLIYFSFDPGPGAFPSSLSLTLFL